MNCVSNLRSVIPINEINLIVELGKALPWNSLRMSDMRVAAKTTPSTSRNINNCPKIVLNTIRSLKGFDANSVQKIFDDDMFFFTETRYHVSRS
jgi:hypothetical protein